jgi:hypothetical protein
MILLSDILANGLNSWGNFKIVVVCTIFSPDVYLTNGLNSLILSGSACIALNRLIKDLPFLLQLQQCHGFSLLSDSVKLISNLGLWWLQKGQWYA